MNKTTLAEDIISAGRSLKAEFPPEDLPAIFFAVCLIAGMGLVLYQSFDLFY